MAFQGHVYHWKNHALLSDTALTVAGVEPAITDAAGRYTLDLGASAPVTLGVGRPGGDGGSNSGITSADALAALRMAVKLSTATPQAWLFVEETRDLWDELALDGQGSSALTRSAATWDRAIGANPQDAADVNLVGILKGDVNGSWTPPADAIELEPVYFQDLASLMGVPENYWG